MKRAGREPRGIRCGLASLDQLFFSISDWVLTMVCSLGNVWNEERKRQRGRASAVIKPSGATDKRLCEGK